MKIPVVLSFCLVLMVKNVSSTGLLGRLFAPSGDPSVSNGLSALIPQSLPNPVQPLLNTVSNVGGMGRDITKGVLGTGLNAVGTVNGMVQDATKGVVGKGLNAVGTVNGMVQDATKGVVGTGLSVAGTVNGMVQDATGVNPTGMIAGFVQPFMTLALENIIQPLIALVMDRIGMIQNAARAMVQNTLDRIPVPIKTVVLTIIDVAKSLISMVTQSRAPVINEGTLAKAR